MLTNRFDNALHLACRIHRHQTRKTSGAPFVAHLLRVSGTIMEFGGSEDEAIAGLLHDAIEDTGPGARLDIAMFGRDVLRMVEAVTETDEDPKPPWKERKLKYIEHLKQADASVALIAAADKLDNARSLLAEYERMGEDVWQCFRAGREESLWFFQSCADALSGTEHHPLLVRELQRTVHALYLRACPPEIQVQRAYLDGP